MNQPTNGKWSFWQSADGMEYLYYWNGYTYVKASDITDETAFASNPDYVRDNVGNNGDLFYNSTLDGVDVIANRIKKIFSTETYNTPKKRANALFVAVAIVATVLGGLIYFKKIKI